eukprot:6289281-Prymnesium_polylepis.2
MYLRRCTFAPGYLRGCNFAQAARRQECPFALGQSLRVMLDDPFHYYKDKRLLARLSGASELGEFTAYNKIEVTAAGRDRGYFDLQCGEYVNVPQSRVTQGRRTQLPVLDGLVCRILVGERAAGEKKKSDMQYDFLCLSFVHKHSIYVSEINSTLGLYDSNIPGRHRFSDATRRSPWYWDFDSQHDPKEFKLALASLKCTSPTD